PADQRRAPLGPEVSWPAGYSDREYQGGDHRYPAQQAAQPPEVTQGQRPYAAFSASGYGDDGYQDPGYQGPAAQDAGIAGTRTVSGFVESSQTRAGYQETGYGRLGYPQPSSGMHNQPNYAGSSYGTAGEIEMA